MTISVERDVHIPMRDGTVLLADLLLPASLPAPVLLQRTPYNKRLLSLVALSADPLRLAETGYAVVVQDTRGRFASQGEFRPFEHEAEDGYDTIEWCAAQRWSDGNVGMYGPSYVGHVQLQAAALRPPHLRAIAPSMTWSSTYRHLLYPGGAFKDGNASSWVLTTLAANALARLAGSPNEAQRAVRHALGGVDRMRDVVRRLPLRAAPIERWAEAAPWYQDWLDHPGFDDYWRARDTEDRLDQMSVPAFHTGGWYDLFLNGTLATHTGLRARAGTREARENQPLLIGPWVHGFPWLDNPICERYFGTASSGAAIDHQGLQIRWFDRWLKGSDPGDGPSGVRLFVMGVNEWRDEASWPLARAVPTRYFLHSRGRANTLAGNGALSTEPPDSEPPDVYRYDPADPTPTLGGAFHCTPAGYAAGVFDQRGVERREDVLCYTSEPLDRDLEVIGPVSVVLFASSSAVDTDFTAKLLDVHADGRALNLCDGIVRARYRADPSVPELLEPGRVYEFRIDLGATANVFRRGHRIRLEVASANFPFFSRHPNSGGDLSSETALHPARQSVHHDAGLPSHLLLSLVPR